MHDACRADHREGYLTKWNWVWDIGAATSWYSRDFLMINWNYYQASDFRILPDINLSSHEDVIALIIFVFSI